MRKRKVGNVGNPNGAAIISDLIDSCGTGAAFAKSIGCHYTCVSHWERMYAKVPIRYVLEICKVYRVEPYKLRPDIFSADMKITFKRRSNDIKS